MGVNMRLIDADKIIITRQEYVGALTLKERLRRLLDSQPTVDAESVRHGRWIEVDVGDCCYRCSECGFIRDAYLLDIGNYCPKCGAKMDGEGK